MDVLTVYKKQLEEELELVGDCHNIITCTRTSHKVVIVGGSSSGKLNLYCGYTNKSTIM